MDLQRPHAELPDELLVTQCAWCFAPATETATAEVGDEEFEIDFCAEHLDEVLTGSRPAP